MLGHSFLGIDLTVLSLSGIVVNDSIIRVNNDLEERALEGRNARLEGCWQRLRAALLTSLTIIAGLAPLRFDTSYQAQFPIPLAASITFGLAFATVLVLLEIPVLLFLYEDFDASRRVRKALAIKDTSK